MQNRRRAETEMADPSNPDSNGETVSDSGNRADGGSDAEIGEGCGEEGFGG